MGNHRTYHGNQRKNVKKKCQRRSLFFSALNFLDLLDNELAQYSPLWWELSHPDDLGNVPFGDAPSDVFVYGD